MTKSISTVRFSRSESTVPKSTDGLRSSRNQARDLAVLHVLPDVDRVHPGGDVPVDVADVVAGLVLAQVGQVDAVAAEQAPVVALEQAVERPDDLPVEALEDALRR